jgi:thioredoxin reductase (NADPH)
MSTTHKTKVAIIGSGPAGYSAAIYAARANLEPIIINGNTPGGQLTITTDVENYPGFAEAVQGPWLVEQMEKQAVHVGTKIFYDHIIDVDFSKRPFKMTGESGDIFEVESVVIATGAQAKWLGLESEKKYQGFGVSGCATCDAFFFKNKDVIVVGGGNSAVEEALYLTNHAKKVYLVHRRDKFKAEKILQDRLFKNPKIPFMAFSNKLTTPFSFLNTHVRDLGNALPDCLAATIGAFKLLPMAPESPQDKISIPK